LTIFRRQRYLFLLGNVRIVIGLFFTAVLLYFWGLTGMALERTVTALLITGLMFWYLISREAPHSPWKDLFVFDAEDRDFMRRLFQHAGTFMRRTLVTLRRLRI